MCCCTGHVMVRVGNVINIHVFQLLLRVQCLSGDPPQSVKSALGATPSPSKHGFHTKHMKHTQVTIVLLGALH